MNKFIVAASCLAAGASALSGTGGLTDFLLLDSLSHDSHYYGGHNDLLPLLAFGGLGGTATTGLTDYILFDQLSQHSYGGHSNEYLPLMALTGNTAAATDILVLDSLSHNSHHNDFLPMMVLSGQSTIGTSNPELTNLWALNQFAGGHHSDFSDLAALSTFGGVTGSDLTSAWGLQQMHNGHHSALPLMAMTGQTIPQDFTSLWALNQFSHGGHSYYPRRHYGHGYARDAPRRVIRQPVATPVTPYNA
jgi:hypothetical protein